MLKMKYFVLNPKAKDGYDMFARASQDAMLAYSERIRTTDPLLANQLLVWAEKESCRQHDFLRADEYDW
jgi:hypothetical protein